MEMEKAAEGFCFNYLNKCIDFEQSALTTRWQRPQNTIPKIECDIAIDSDECNKNYLNITCK